MDAWEIPQSSRSDLDGNFLMDALLTRCKHGTQRRSRIVWLVGGKGLVLKDFEPLLQVCFDTGTREQGGSKSWIASRDAMRIGGR